MKKYIIAALLLGAAVCLPGCGFTEGTDAIVTVVQATPTPTPAPTPTPEPAPVVAEATPTPEPAVEQTPSGVKVTVQNGTYTANADINLRTDCSADATWVASVPSGTTLNSTGVCENGWIRVDYNGQACYASGDYVTAAAQ